MAQTWARCPCHVLQNPGPGRNAHATRGPLRRYRHSSPAHYGL